MMGVLVVCLGGIFTACAWTVVQPQCNRLGANYLTLPINQPKTAFHNNHYGKLFWCCYSGR